MGTIQYEGYLTHEKLYDILKNQLKLPLEREVKVGTTKYKYDFVIPIGDDKLAIEFDGFYHFTNASNIIRDDKKDKIWEDLGYSLIRIPYFVQLTTDTFSYYFNKLHAEVKVLQSYPHGFIDNKACLPANYCSLGIQKYKKIIEKLPKAVSNSILKSLKDLELKKDLLEIYPVNLNN